MVWRRTEVAVTGLTRNQFISLIWYKGSNPFVSVFIHKLTIISMFSTGPIAFVIGTFIFLLSTYSYVLI